MSAIAAHMPRDKMIYLDNSLFSFNSWDDFNDLVKNPLCNGRRRVCLPPGVAFNTRDFLGPEEYLIERQLVDKYAPENYAGYYRFVSEQDILFNRHPMSFPHFLRLHSAETLHRLDDYKNYLMRKCNSVLLAHYSKRE